ncbi:DNA replication complex GINS protein SLD5 isoform X3 [Petromyzon marinus]|uniref:DNA replication complex GINS protein SLD5 isoform X3 n=1 Tax=Petromyzon marinus TaxID=7757 RepID=A0AAJ7TAT8_PETMA|nr:DNA replication complex GINS protein SLD5 isoform X3 [Petromyzon marinus]
MEDLHELEGTRSGEEEEEGEEVTPAELVSRLREAWLNEKLCPDLLPQHSELTECVVEQLTHMEGNLRRVQRADVKSSLHRMELERIRFMLSSYLRTRLNKVCFQHGKVPEVCGSEAHATQPTGPGPQQSSAPAGRGRIRVPACARAAGERPRGGRVQRAEGVCGGPGGRLAAPHALLHRGPTAALLFHPPHLAPCLFPVYSFVPVWPCESPCLIV